MDATVNDVVDRARLQIIRADELLSRTLDRVEETSDMVHKTVVSPVRQFSGLIQGVTAGIEFLFGGRGRKKWRRAASAAARAAGRDVYLKRSDRSRVCSLQRGSFLRDVKWIPWSHSLSCSPRLLCV